MTVLGTPYRLGSTSYVWPDDLVSNVRRLGPLVDDVELVLFEVNGRSNLPDATAIEVLDRLAQANDLTYTVHLPLDLDPAHPLSLEKARKVIACTRVLSPWAYVVHLDGRAVEGDPPPAALARWWEDARQLLEEVVALAGNERRVCVENLENYSPEHLLPLLDRLPVGLCVDVGHLWLAGADPLPFLARHLARTRVVHLHGIDGRGHQSLVHQGVEQVAPILDLLAEGGFGGVLTLEVFLDDFAPSRALVAEVVNGKW